MGLAPQGVTPAAALQAFRNHPRTFLQHNLFNVGDFPGQASGIVNNVYFYTSGYEIAQRYGSVLRSHNLHTAQDFMFSPAVPMGYPNVQLNVQFIQMYAFNNLAGIQWHALSNVGGDPDIMITTKLTGCSFLVRVVNGAVECAHVQPNGAAIPPQTGQALRQYLSQQHAGNYTSLYGRGRTGNKGYEATEGATVVGLRNNNGWRIYAQRLVAGQTTFKDVERIYPR